MKIVKNVKIIRKHVPITNVEMNIYCRKYSFSDLLRSFQIKKTMLVRMLMVITNDAIETPARYQIIAGTISQEFFYSIKKRKQNRSNCLGFIKIFGFETQSSYFA